MFRSSISNSYAGKDYEVGWIAVTKDKELPRQFDVNQFVERKRLSSGIRFNKGVGSAKSGGILMNGLLPC